jgi:hypothetical protein
MVYPGDRIQCSNKKLRHRRIFIDMENVNNILLYEICRYKTVYTV